MKDLIKNQNFIIFGEDFNRHPHALEHILRPLFDENKFIWVETIGLRSPKLNFYDLKRILEKLSSFFKIKKTQTKNNFSNVHIVSPFMIPFNQLKIVRLFNTWSVNRSVYKKIKELNLVNIISITSVPNACDYVANFNEVKTIYFCVDEFSLWPGLNYQLVKNMEHILFQKVDLIIATSNELAKNKFKKNIPTKVIGHGVEFEKFDNGVIEYKKTEVLKICYFGLFDERTEQDILKYIALNGQNLEINIFGNVVCNVSDLSSIPNIHFHGKVPYQKLDSVIKDQHIFILPYKINELTKNINPLKLKEYLSTSRLVISTPLNEVRPFENYLLIASTKEEFLEKIFEYQKGNSFFDFNRTREYIKRNETWEAKTRILCEFLK